MGMGLNCSSPLGMSRVTGKYMEVGDEDGEDKTHPHPAPLSCLDMDLMDHVATCMSMHKLMCRRISGHSRIECGIFPFPSLLLSPLLTCPLHDRFSLNVVNALFFC